ncbi:MAG: hypothetical protein J2P48_07860 [Alphaproteobacteria bacterium]|nr:hypothetical protein [Alphaproteobacteria bacterium]
MVASISLSGSISAIVERFMADLAEGPAMAHTERSKRNRRRLIVSTGAMRADLCVNSCPFLCPYGRPLPILTMGEVAAGTHSPRAARSLRRGLGAQNTAFFARIAFSV